MRALVDPIVWVGALLAAGAFFLTLAGTRLRRRRRLAALRSGTTGCGCLALGALLVAAAFNLHTYQRLTHEQPAATLSFSRTGEQRFLVRLEDPATGETRRFELAGDQWQLEARVLKWHPLGNLLGLDTRYRLERLTGRYTAVADETRAVRTAHSLAEDRGLDIWANAQTLPDWLPLVDARYGSATYLPMADGARYRVTVSQSGLIARPDNDAATSAAGEW